MTKRFNVIVDDMEVSIKDNESELMEYPFSLTCESIDDFDPLIHECLQVEGLLNTLHQENQQWKEKLSNALDIARLNQKDVMEFLAKNRKLREENEQLRKSIEHMISKATEISNRNVQLHEQLGSTQFQLQKEKAKTMELQMKIDYLCEKYGYKGE